MYNVNGWGAMLQVECIGIEGNKTYHLHIPHPSPYKEKEKL